jgi:anaerobic ribonucleoside-triphosphate reductase activating protein
VIRLVKIAGIKYESFVDAEGVSCVLFVSGCKHNCLGCQSPKTHNFNFGSDLTDEIIDMINDELDKRPFLSALVLSGGDPLYSATELLPVIDKLHIPHNTIWCYTGFTIEELLNDKDSDMYKLISKCSYLVDGKFEIEKRDITLKFRGSSNQRIFKRTDNNEWVDVTDQFERG